jgi:hypothetical protein
MGSVQRCNGFLKLTELKNKLNLTQFVETGTYRGDAIQTAIDLGFQDIFSVELYKEFADAARTRFKLNPNVAILNGTSESLLPGIIRQLKGNTLWWLDAHLQCTYGGTPAEIYENQFPLHIELSTMLVNRDCSKDLILIDDLRIYENGPFGCGNAPAHHSCSKAGIGWLESMLAATHIVTKYYADEGYIVCTPKEG